MKEQLFLDQCGMARDRVSFSGEPYRVAQPCGPPRRAQEQLSALADGGRVVNARK